MSRDTPLSRLADTVSVVLLLADSALGLWCRSKLPETVPIHWGLDGRPNGYGPRAVNAIVFPALGWAVYLLLLYLPVRDARKRNDPRILPVFAFYRLVIVLFLVVMHVAVLGISLGHRVDMALLVRILMPLLFLVLGAGFFRLPPNSYGGFRLPWTFRSETAWTKTHQFAGRLWVVGSLAALAGAGLPLVPGALLLAGTIGLLTVAPIVYAFTVRND